VMSSKNKMKLQALAMAEAQHQNIKEDIKRRIKILPELRDLIPPLEGKEREQLESNIKAEGCREPLIVWVKESEDPILVDGHNRYGICQKLNVDFKLVEKEFPNLEAVKDFMIDNQLGRRNLSSEMASYLRGMKYERYKAKEKNTDNLKQFKKDEKGEATEVVKMATSEKTHEKLAKEFNVSGSTIMRDADFAKGIEFIGKSNPELKQQIISGKAKVKKDAVRTLGKQQDKITETTEIKKPEDIQALAESLKTTKKPKAVPKKSASAKANGVSTSNPFANRNLTLMDMVRYTLLVAEKYPGELKESGNEKKDLQQLQRLAIKALVEYGKKEEGEWLKMALEKEISLLSM
jgi:hypothetical protein